MRSVMRVAASTFVVAQAAEVTGAKKQKSLLAKRQMQDYGGAEEGAAAEGQEMEDCPTKGQGKGGNAEAGAQNTETAPAGGYRGRRAQEKARAKNGGRGGRGGNGCGGNGNGNGNTPQQCATRPCAAARFGDIGSTVVSGAVARTGRQIPVGENIYSPFEIAFGDQMNTFLESLGCATGAAGHFPEGIDTIIAQKLVAHQCGITLPRTEGDNYLALMDECGGHTDAYHFHESMACLYDASGSAAGHSIVLGEEFANAAPGTAKKLYGKFENGSNTPQLDACNGHFGVTPDSDGQVVYHYHITDSAPFTFGCYGPDVADIDGQRTEILMTVEKCRALYSIECGNGDNIDLTIGNGQTISYDPWCPCFDSAGSNTGNAGLPVFANSMVMTASGAVASDAVVVVVQPQPQAALGVAGPNTGADAGYGAEAATGQAGGRGGRGGRGERSGAADILGSIAMISSTVVLGLLVF